MPRRICVNAFFERDIITKELSDKSHHRSRLIFAVKRIHRQVIAKAFHIVRMRTDAFPEERVEVKSLRALTLATKGDFQSLPSPQWTLSGTAGAVTLAEGSFLLEGEPTVICGNHPLIPQRISTAFEAEIDYTDTNGLPSHWTVTSPIVEKNFIPGRSYYLDLTFSVETCTLITP